MDLILLRAWNLLYSSARQWDAHPERRSDPGWKLAAGKYTVTNNAISVTNLALRINRSAGLQRRFPLKRYFRDVRVRLGNLPMDDEALVMLARRAFEGPPSHTGA